MNPIAPWIATPKGQNFRWVLDDCDNPKQITVIPISKFPSAQKTNAALKQVFDFMHHELSHLNSLDKASLKTLRERVVRQYDKYWNYRCVFAYLFDQFLSLFCCSCGLTSSYKRLISLIDANG